MFRKNNTNKIGSDEFMIPEPTKDENARLAALERQIEDLRPKAPKADTCSRCALYVQLGKNFSHDRDGRFICGYCVNEQRPELDLDSAKDWAASRLLGFQNKRVGIAKAVGFKFAYELPYKVKSEAKRYVFVDREQLRNAYDEANQPGHVTGALVEVAEYHGKYGEKVVKHSPVFVTRETEIRRSPNRPLSKEERQDQEIAQLEEGMKAKLARQISRKLTLDQRIEKLQQQRAEIP